MSDRLWVLGAPDPEMAAIEGLLHEAGERVVHATDERGERVHPGGAYRMRPLDDAVIPWGGTIYLVECDVDAPWSTSAAGDPLPERIVTRPGSPDTVRVARIDHHRPGDPGHGRPPEEFLPASSIGQVVAILARLNRLPTYGRDSQGVGHFGPDAFYLHSWAAAGCAPGTLRYIPGWGWRVVLTTGASAPYWGVTTPTQVAEIPCRYLFAAAADHCLGAAYRGACPGVDPDALMEWRAATRAQFQSRPVEQLLRDVALARDVLRAAPEIVLDGSSTARDLRGQHVPELPEAAARDGVCFVSAVTERDGREKIVCQAGTPEQIQAFMRVWAPAHGLVGIYGDPQRGIAGGYVARDPAPALTASHPGPR